MVNQRPAPTARQLRRRRMHERQAVIFGLLIGALVIVAVFALGVATGAVKSPIDRAIQTAAPVDDVMTTAQPCLPQGTKPVAYSKVTVNVYNASTRSGLAKAVSTNLDERGFVIGKLGNNTQPIKSARIVFGPKGLARAYTLAANVPDAKLVLDTRKSATVDLVLGPDYTSLTPTADVGLSAKKAMTSVAGCVALSKVTPLAPLPAATTAPTKKAASKS